jgi:hypothetical protein
VFASIVCSVSIPYQVRDKLWFLYKVAICGWSFKILQMLTGNFLLI